jgi:hypothetical protein
MLIPVFLSFGRQAEALDQRLVLGEGFDSPFCIVLAAAVSEAQVQRLQQPECRGSPVAFSKAGCSVFNTVGSMPFGPAPT